ncbi:ABC transporter ATP-binding protein [Dongia sp.]|uniref:ABC transporter ATP-binding protein n=1 Tax=Dongia sp. TaxID=1977262 RepID=UPI0035B0777A
MAVTKNTGDILLDVRDLSVEFASPKGAVRVIDRLSFDLRAGETLCIAGESGSGKSVTALSLMGLLPKPGGRIAQGSAQFLGRDLFKLSEPEMAEIRGNEIAMIFQEPMTSLNPVLSIGTQLTEGLVRHLGLSRAGARQRALEALEAVRISEPQRRLKQYPHELSGGMRQRVMIAMAMAAKPKILIADEPTTALDVTIQAQILELMATLQRETGTAIIMITHDMGVVAEIADRVVVMKKGEAVERGETAAIFAHQNHAYTKALLAAVPSFSHGAAAPLAPDLGGAKPLIEVKDLIVRFDVKGGLLQQVQQRVHAVEKVSFDLMPGETLALVGESGCGKSTTGKALMHLVPCSGDIRIEGEAAGRKSSAELKAIRRRVQMIFQDPLASLDPRMNVGDLVMEPLVIHGIGTPAERREKAAELFRRVGLTPDQLARFPHEFSGGQRQRICIARALALGPKAIVADECVSALDVSIQAQILELMQELQDELGIAYLFISHDMAVVERISHRVAVMSMGQIVETGPTRAVLGNPQHAYTRKLLSAVPIPDPARRHAEEWQRDRKRIEGEVPSPFRPADFTPEFVTFRDLGGGHLVAA